MPHEDYAVFAAIGGIVTVIVTAMVLGVADGSVSTAIGALLALGGVAGGLTLARRQTG